MSYRSLVEKIDFSNKDVKLIIESIFSENSIKIEGKKSDEMKNKFKEFIYGSALDEKSSLNFLNSLIKSCTEGNETPEFTLKNNSYGNNTKPTEFISKSQNKQIEILSKIVLTQPKNIVLSLYKEILKFTYIDTERAISDDYDVLTFKFLTPEAKKSVALYHYKKLLFTKNPDILYLDEGEQNTFIKNKSDELLKNLRKVRFEGSDYIESLTNFGIPNEVRMMGDAHIVNYSAEVQWLKSSIDKIDAYDDINVLQNLFDKNTSGYDEKLRHYIFGETISLEEYSIDLEEASLDTKTFSKGLDSLKKPTLPYHPMLNDVKVSDRVNKFGRKQFEELFHSFYGKIAKELIETYGGIQPEGFSIDAIVKSTINFEEKEGEKGILFKGFWSHKSGEESSGFKEKISQIGMIVKSLIKDMKILKKDVLLDFDEDGITKPLSGYVKHISFYRENKYFEASNVSYFKNDEEEELLQFSIGDELKMTDITYLTVQIGYFLKFGKIIKKEELYSKIFKEYSSDQNKGEKVHDITVFEEQYQQLFEHLIRPLSKEGKELGIKPLNTLLAGSAGTGKSQFMINLLVKDEFELNSNKVSLDAIVIGLSVEELKYVINNDKTIFNTIAEKARLPVIIVIEDIDTPMKEGNSQGGDKFSQELTTLMTGLGSIDVYFVSSTNHRRDFSPRLLRPGRFENVITYGLPFSEKIINELISVHSKMNKLSDHELRIVKSYIPKMQYFSTSYIAKFIEAIADKKVFNGKFNKKAQVTDSEIDIIFNNIIIPLNEIINNEKDLSLRKESLQIKTEKQKIGFNK